MPSIESQTLTSAPNATSNTAALGAIAAAAAAAAFAAGAGKGSSSGGSGSAQGRTLSVTEQKLQALIAERLGCFEGNALKGMERFALSQDYSWFTRTQRRIFAKLHEMPRCTHYELKRELKIHASTLDKALSLFRTLELVRTNKEKITLLSSESADLSVPVVDFEHHNSAAINIELLPVKKDKLKLTTCAIIELLHKFKAISIKDLKELTDSSNARIVASCGQLLSTGRAALSQGVLYYADKGHVLSAPLKAKKVSTKKKAKSSVSSGLQRARKSKAPVFVNTIALPTLVRNLFGEIELSHDHTRTTKHSPAPDPAAAAATPAAATTPAPAPTPAPVTTPQQSKSNCTVIASSSTPAPASAVSAPTPAAAAAPAPVTSLQQSKSNGNSTVIASSSAPAPAPVVSAPNPAATSAPAPVTSPQQSKSNSSVISSRSTPAPATAPAVRDHAAVSAASVSAQGSAVAVPVKGEGLSIIEMDKQQKAYAKALKAKKRRARRAERKAERRAERHDAQRARRKH